MEKKTLDEQVIEMKALAHVLMPFTFPMVDFKYEQEILLLKRRCLVVDGIDLIVCYSKADYQDHILESLQLQSSFAPFLSFAIVCKLGRAFLGQHNLSYIEFFRNSKKIYCWMVKSRNERLLRPDEDTTPGSYEGFEYSVLPLGSVDLF